jgi:type IX secretion system PorP/SprF family membrane protein
MLCLNFKEQTYMKISIYLKKFIRRFMRYIKMRKFTLFILFGLMLIQKNAAQDSHFTQFYAAPLTLNPALTGAFEGRYRVGTVYRDQWRQVLDNPMRTFAAGGDLRLKSPFRKIKNDAFGLGLIFTNDRIGLINFNTSQIAVSLAYHKALDSDGTQFLSIGFQGGLTQRSVSYDALNFQDEFDGFSGFNFGTGEDLPPNNFAYGDYSVGLNYTAKFGRNSTLFAGAAMHHFNQPQVAFGPDIADGSEILFTKVSLQVAANMPLSRNSKVSFLPRVLIARQGLQLQMNAGANFRTAFPNGTTALHLGGWARPVRNNDSMGLDAVVAMMGIELNNVLIGLSYDINTRALAARQRQGAFEFSLVYLGNYDNEDILCPKF